MTSILATAGDAFGQQLARAAVQHVVYINNTIGWGARAKLNRIERQLVLVVHKHGYADSAYGDQHCCHLDAAQCLAKLHQKCVRLKRIT